MYLITRFSLLSFPFSKQVYFWNIAVIILVCWFTIISAKANTVNTIVLIQNTQQQTSQLPISLEPQKTVSQELAGGESSTYQINLVEGDCAHIVVEQQGIDVTVRLFNPEGVQIGVDFDSPNSSNGPEQAYIIAPTTGIYKIVVTSLTPKAAKGKFRIELAYIQQATELDKMKADAQLILAKAEQLYGNKQISLKEVVSQYEQIIPVWRKAGDKRILSDVLLFIARRQIDVDNGLKALPYYQEVLELKRDLGDKRIVGEALGQLAFLYASLQEPEKAIDACDQALKVFTELKSLFGQLTVLNTKASMLKLKGENRQAIPILEESLRIAKETKHLPSIGRAFNGIGTLYDDINERTKALSYYKEALPIRRQLNDKNGEAITLSNIGLTYSALGEKQKAFDSYFDSLKLFENLERKDPKGQGILLNNIALCYDEIGNSTQTLIYYEKSLVLRKQAQDHEGQAYTLNNLGKYYVDQGQIQKANQVYKEALEIRKTLGNKPGLAYSYLNIGVVEQLSGNIKGALDNYLKALDLHKEVGNRQGQAIVLRKIAILEFSQDNKEKALSLLNESLKISEETEDKRNLAETLYWLARFQQANQEFQQAKTNVEQAINLTKGLRSKVADPNLRASYFATVRDYYETYISVLLELHQQFPDKGYAKIALIASENAHARSLLEQVLEVTSKSNTGALSDLLEQKRFLFALYNDKLDRLARLHNTNKVTEQEVVRKEVAQAQEEYQRIETQLRQANPRLADTQSPQTISLEQLQNTLTPNNIILEYFVGKEKSFLWLVTTSKLYTFQLENKESLIAAINRFSLAVSTQPASSSLSELYKLNEPAGQLSQKLLGSQAVSLDDKSIIPFSLLKSKKQIIVIGDDLLHTVAWPALTVPTANTKQSRYVPLVAQYEFISLPSASLLPILNNTIDFTKTMPNALILADPVFSVLDERYQNSAKVHNNDKNLVSFSDERELASAKPLPRLKNTILEANEIKTLLGKQGKIISSFEANLETLLQQNLSQYNIVHLATHSYVDLRNPEYCGVVLSLINEQGQETERAVLGLEQIQLLPLQPGSLVVLSSCDTNSGKLIAGEGLVGLSQAFFSAGANQVISSLWKVADESTAKLMATTYRNIIRQKVSPSTALHAAQTSFWRQKIHPYFWASFTFQGNWKPQTVSK